MNNDERTTFLKELAQIFACYRTFGVNRPRANPQSYCNSHECILGKTGYCLVRRTKRDLGDAVFNLEHALHCFAKPPLRRRKNQPGFIRNVN